MFKEGKSRCVIRGAASMMWLLYWALRDWRAIGGPTIRRDIAFGTKAGALDESLIVMVPSKLAPVDSNSATYGLTVRRSTNWTKGGIIFKKSKLLNNINGADYRIELRWPTDYKSVALPTELSRHTKCGPRGTSNSDIRINSPPFYQLN